MSENKIETFGFLWVVITVGALLIDECSATATFQVDVGDLFKTQKISLPLSSIIDYRQTNLETVKNVNFVYFSR